MEFAVQSECKIINLNAVVEVHNQKDKYIRAIIIH